MIVHLSGHTEDPRDARNLARRARRMGLDAHQAGPTVYVVMPADVTPARIEAAFRRGLEVGDIPEGCSLSYSAPFEMEIAIT